MFTDPCNSNSAADCLLEARNQARRNSGEYKRKAKLSRISCCLRPMKESELVPGARGQQINKYLPNPFVCFLMANNVKTLA